MTKLMKLSEKKDWSSCKEARGAKADRARQTTSWGSESPHLLTLEKLQSTGKTKQVEA